MLTVVGQCTHILPVNYVSDTPCSEIQEDKCSYTLSLGLKLRLQVCGNYSSFGTLNHIGINTENNCLVLLADAYHRIKNVHVIIYWY